MAHQWTEWEERKYTTPYIDWWKNVAARFVQGGQELFSTPVSLDRLIEKQNALLLRTNEASLEFLDKAPDAKPKTQTSEGPTDISVIYPGAFSQPVHTENRCSDFDPNSIEANGGKHVPDGALGILPDDPSTHLDKNTIIVGVIDSDIPLGHHRFRHKDGTTRILAAWQTLAEWGVEGDCDDKEAKANGQCYMPFGREFYGPDIDDLLERYSNASGWLDEDAFNKATGVLDTQHLLGRRQIASRVSHGAHVLDIAAGADPDAESEFARRIKIIAVNIPTSSTFGASGTFLDNYMLYAVRRIATIADEAWVASNGEPKAGAPAGYPIVINISFGKQAGAKSTLDYFPDELKKIQEERKAKKLSSLLITMPAGNDNLLSCNAFLEPESGKTMDLEWRISPEDHSSNFVEIWTENRGEFEGLPLEISLIPAGFTPTTPSVGTQFPVSLGIDKTVQELGDYARMYCDKIGKRYRYVLCVAPTYSSTSGIVPAPAGAWTIRLRNRSTDRIQCQLSVQTDQQVSLGSPNNLRSYFVDKHYREYDDAGRQRGSYWMSDQGIENLDATPCTAIRRHGTMNASAGHKMVARVGGYRLSDGQPAPYSATGRGRTKGQDDGTSLGYSLSKDSSGAPTVSFPTDDGPAHFGILAAGSADGSVVAMRGTSFASSQATRHIVNHLMRPSTASSILNVNAHIIEDRRTHDPIYSNWRIDVVDSLGGGRLPKPIVRRVKRTDFNSG